MRSIWALALVVAGTACVHSRAARPARVETIEVTHAVFRVRYSPEDADVARQVARALERAVPVAGRWGTLEEPVVVTIHPTHDELEAATRREGFRWLRAWAGYSTVDLQSPRTWTRGRPSEAVLERLLTHELTHCVMYQAVGNERTWRDRSLPIWFREGMASVTAGEPSGPAPAAADGCEGGAADSLGRLERCYRGESASVYEVSRRAFRFLVDRHGEERVRRLLECMGEGEDFAEAFEEAVGIPVQEFEREFRSHEAS